MEVEIIETAFSLYINSSGIRKRNEINWAMPLFSFCFITSISNTNESHIKST